VQLLEGVRETIEALNGRYRLMLLTKGDLFDQESKRCALGPRKFFDAVEIVSTKNASTYRTIMTRHTIAPEQFVMVGNSLRSDVLPALEAGALAMHIPYEMTWAHEHLDEETLAGLNFGVLERIDQLPDWLRER
jgi:putative hydrolase of the HAD superfamily